MDETLKIIAGIASIFALYKVFADVIVIRSSKRREEYSFSKQFMLDLKDDSIHKYVLEKGFLALTGNIYSLVEIRYLLSYEQPSIAIEKRADAEGFIEYDFKIGCYVWKGNYRYRIIQKIGRPVFMLFYIVFCSLAVFPLFIDKISLFEGLTKVFVTLAMLAIAILSLSKHEKILQAKLFMEMTKKHNLSEPRLGLTS